MKRIDVIEFLEYKIELNSITDDEYGLYIECLKYGEKILSDPTYRKIVKRLIEQIKDEWEGKYI